MMNDTTPTKETIMNNRDFFANPLGNDLPAEIEIVTEIENSIVEHVDPQKLRGDYRNFAIMLENMFNFKVYSIADILLTSENPVIKIKKTLKTFLDPDIGDCKLDSPVFDIEMCADIMTKIAVDSVKFYLEPLKSKFKYSKREELLETLEETVCESADSIDFDAFLEENCK
jgi:hypothetical protein